MKKSIKGLLICPDKRTITEVEVNSEDSLQAMYNLIECSAVDVGRGGLQFLPSSPQDDVWFDDEAAFSDKKTGFMLPGWVPLTGNGLILGFDDEGNCTDHTLTTQDVETLRQKIRWMVRFSS